MRTWLCLAMALSLGGCVTPQQPLLKWESRSPAAALEGRVIIQSYANQRPEGRGAEKANQVGTWRTGIGIPKAIHTDREMLGNVGNSVRQLSQPVEEGMRALVADALQAAGLGTAEPGDPAATARVAIELKELWVEGYGALTSKAALVLVVLDPVSNAERLRVPVSREVRVDVNFFTSPEHYVVARTSLRNALSLLYADLVGLLGQQPVRDALLGVGVAPVPPPAVEAAPAPSASPAAPAVPGCGKDTDCKGERICQDGRCVDPAPRPK